MTFIIVTDVDIVANRITLRSVRTATTRRDVTWTSQGVMSRVCDKMTLTAGIVCRLMRYRERLCSFVRRDYRKSYILPIRDPFLQDL